MNIAVGLICVKNQGLRWIIGLIIILIEELKYLEEREKGKRKALVFLLLLNPSHRI